MSRSRRLFRRWKLHRHRGPWKIPEDPRHFPVYLLMGQSNMAGFGCIPPSDPWQEGDRSPVPRVLVLGGQGSVKSARPRGWLRWQSAAHPLHFNQRSAGFGLGLPFAVRLLEEMPDCRIGLVPCAWGGVGIDALGPGSPLYANSLRRARIAAKSGTLAGVLWHQGETDAADDSLTRAHADKLAGLIRQLRHDLSLPRLPFVIGDLAPFGDERRTPAAVELRALVRAGLRRVAATAPHAAFVKSEGLTGVDPVHFDRAALIEFGRRYAEAIRGLAAG